MATEGPCHSPPKGSASAKLVVEPTPEIRIVSRSNIATGGPNAHGEARSRDVGRA